MTQSRQLLRSVGLPALLVTVLMPAASQAAGRLPSLAGTTVVSGTRPGVTRVWVPAGSSIDRTPVDNPDVAISGKGRLSGVVFVNEKNPHIFLLLASIPNANLCAADGTCTFGKQFVYWVAPLDMIDSQGLAQLPAGVYRVYLFTDGKAATIRLRFHGLKGSLKLQPSTHAYANVAAPKQKSPGTTGKAFWAGVTRSLPRNGLLLNIDWIVSNGPGAGENGQCVYSLDGQGQDPPNAYQPPCKDAASTSMASHLNNRVTPVSSTSWGLLEVVNRGQWGQGWWYADSASLDHAGAISLWLAY